MRKMFTHAEMKRRLATMTDEQIEKGLRMVREGYGAHGITLESSLTMKQANAMFQYAELWKGEPVLAAAPAKKIRDAIIECDRYIEREERLDPSLRPADVAAHLQFCIGHREKLRRILDSRGVPVELGGDKAPAADDSSPARPSDDDAPGM